MDEARFNDTVPWPARRQPEAAHAASEHDDDADGGPQMLGSLLVYAALVVASLALLVMVSR